MSEAINSTQAKRRRFRPYPKYKDSGVEWLCEIPAHWRFSRISELTTLINGFPFDSEYFVRGDGTPLVRIRDLNGMVTEVNYIGPVVENAWIEPGDVIIGMDGDFNIARWRGQRALLNQRMCCLRPRGDTELGFVAHVLPLPLKAINDLTYSTTVKHLSSGDVRKIRLGSPPPDEQRAIAAFLDRETAKIDALIEKKERLIDLLQEKRVALITQAVTKGLDPNVPMKDSGVEWLSEIPAHWKVSRLKTIASVHLSNVDKKSVEGQETVRLCNYVDVYYNERITNSLDFMPSTATKEQVRRFCLKAGDVLITKDSESWTDIAIPAVVAEDLPGVLCGYHLALLHPCDAAIEGRFLARACTAVGPRDQFRVAANGITRFGLTGDAIRSSVFGFPSLLEQNAISAFLDRETAKIDALLAKIQEAIDRLKEYRTALISAAVTGKIDVRQEA